MIYAATREIEAVFKARRWSYEIKEIGDASGLITDFDLKSGDSIDLALISSADNDLSIRVFGFIPIPSGKRDAAIRTCNDVNNQFRFAKFMVSDTDDVRIALDVPIETANLREVAVELLTRLLDIADKAYPIFRKALNG